ncbi:MAG: ABC transporter ATP-binding protein [Pseudomonadota bacterium]
MNFHDNVVRADGVSKSIEMSDRTIHILSDINLAIKTAETVAVTGVSGSGKSTLLGLLAGLDSPTSGTVSIMGHGLDELDEDQRADIRGRHVGFVFQSFLLMPNLTALENVLLPLEIRQTRDARELAGKMLDRVGLSHRGQHYPRQLSGGEQQRVALARAFVTQPDILFADEPTGNLDEKTGEAITDLMFGLNEEHQTTLLLVTHDLELANRCLRNLSMHEGQLVESTPVAGAQ